MIIQCPECNARFMVPDAQIPADGRDVRCGRCHHQWHMLPPPPAVPVEMAASATATAAQPDDDWDPLAMAAERAATTPVEHSGDATHDFAEALQAASSAAATSSSDTPDDATTARADDVDAALPSLAPWAISPRPFMIAAPVLALLWLCIALVAHVNVWAHVPGVEKLYAAIGATPTDGLRFEDVTMQRDEKDGKVRFILAGNISNHSAQLRMVPSVRVKLVDAKGKALWSREYVVKEQVKGGEGYPFRITNVETSNVGAVAAIVVDLGNNVQLKLRG